MTRARRPGAAARRATSDGAVRPAGRTLLGIATPATTEPALAGAPAPGAPALLGAAAPASTEPALGRAPLARSGASAEQEPSGSPDRDRSVSPVRERERRVSHDLFRELHASTPGSDEWRAHRDELVRRHLPLAHYLVRRFAGRGEPMDDLLQVATIGLIKAVDRFDLDRGVEFSTYATPTMVGEVKRYFRDRGWAIRVPRRMQEHTLAVSRATGDLFGRLSRSPTIAELAGYTQLTEEEVLEAIGSAHAYTTVSLDVELAEDSPVGASHPAAGDAQAALDNVEHRASLRPLLSRLSPRERQILALRFFANMTQSEIAAEIGVSQMHVSRLLSRTLARLRESLGHAE